MTATKHKRRSGNPAKPPKPQYRPGIWHRNHRFAIFGIVGATALTLLAGFLGPSAVTLTLGPRHSYLPPWYLPAGVIHPTSGSSRSWFGPRLPSALSDCGSDCGRWLMAGNRDPGRFSRSAPYSACSPSACRR